MSTADLVLGAEVPALLIILQRGGAASFALDVTDANGAAANLTGLTAIIETAGGDEWTATVDGSKFAWSISADVTADLSFGSCGAVLAVTDQAGVRVIWARGTVQVRS